MENPEFEDEYKKLMKQTMNEINGIIKEHSQKLLDILPDETTT